ncbi:uncharacterized protein L201_005919 [Kwoniella dendrophila CBS 6074]|uniref:Uncharacterized protein n=1 Tax=Kwoniella dendrophila CBS 6074 TaxID=1295534 RepID=A0AAX4K2J5_9TREE
MVQIKSSVLVAAAAFSAASALPTSSSNNNIVDLNVNLNNNRASPTKSLSTNDFNDYNTDNYDSAGAATTTALLTDRPTGKSVIDLDVNLGKAQPLLQTRKNRKDEEDVGLKRSVKEMVKNVETKGSGSGSASGRMWKGRPSKRGPWRNGGDLIDLNIGHGAVDTVPENTARPLLNGNLIDLAIRSPKDEDGRHDGRLTGDDDEYYRNSGNSQLQARRHGGHRHSVVEVIGDDYYRHHGGGRGGYEFIETGHSRHRGGNINVNEHIHSHEHYHKRHHQDTVIIEDHDNHHRHRGPKIVEIVGDHHDNYHSHGNVNVNEHIHQHIHDRSHRDHDNGNVVVVDGDRHGRHGGDVTVVNNDNRHHRHGDTTIVNNSGHRHGDTTIVNNDSHRHSGDTTVVNNHKRSSPKLGISSKLAGLGRAFLKRHSSDDRHYRHGDTTIIDNGRHHDTTVINNGRHGDTTLINNGRHGDTTLINTGRHGDTAIIDNSRHHRHGGDTTIVNNKRHHDTTIVSNGRHGDTTLVNTGRHGDTLIVDNDRHHHHGGDTTTVNNDRHHGTTVVNNGRHGDTTVVNNQGSHHRHGGDTTVVNNHKRGHHHSDRIIVIGDNKRYSDADFYYKNSWSNGLRYGNPIYFSNGDSFNRVRMIDNYGYTSRYRLPGSGNQVNIIPADAIPYRTGNRYQKVSYDYGYGYPTYHYGRYGKRSAEDENENVSIMDNDHHNEHEEGQDVNNHKRHHNDHRNDRHHGHNRHEECKHGRCDSNHGDDVTIVNNHKRQMQDNGMGGAPGYIDVTSPVFNSTTATRIASLVLSTSNGTDANSTFVLNASSNIRTQVYLVPINQGNSTTASAAAASSNSTSTSPISVNLKVPIFVASSASVEPYCATFDPSPENPAPLTVTPCTTENDPSSHESQRFLYNPDTGVIHPDWQPSTDAQQLLQAVPDSVDDSEASVNDIDMSENVSADQAMMTASATMAAMDAYATSGDYDAAAMQTGAPTMSALARRATITPSASASGSMSTSSTTGNSSTMSSPPPLITSGPQSSTASTKLPQSNVSGSGSNASNVTLIFTPVNPAIVNSASVNFDSSLNDDDMLPTESSTQSGMNSQQATMNTNSKRGFQAVNPDINSNNNADINNNNNNGNNGDQSTSTFSSSSTSGSGDLNNASSTNDDNNNNNNFATQAATPAPAAPSSTSGSSSSNGNGIHANAKVNVGGGAINSIKGDSLLQKPMVAPESLTAPYEWRWTKADSADETALSKSTVV